MTEQQVASQVNNKRIAKNTIFLYFRMAFIMIVNLYASRVVLRVLGAEDFGTYNVVGGVISMLSLITASIGSATSRFITFELGKGVDGDAKRMFRCSISIFYIFAIAALMLGESIGLWFVKSKLNIPSGREVAAMWVYQFSIVSFIVSLISISYNALIIAKEKMNAFAYISIFDGMARLGILFLLPLSKIDHLILYGGLLTLVQLLICIFNICYCKYNFTESSPRWLWNKDISKEVFKYSGWTMIGQASIVGYTQGINILLNIYFGSVVNAARSIATQVQLGLAQFYANFQTAVKPQVIKCYAQKDLTNMHSLVLRTGRLSFLLAIAISLPIFFYIDYILQLWLVTPPEHTASFVRLTIIAGLSNSLSQHTIMAIHATGDLKRFQIIEGLCLLSILPIAWLLVKRFNTPCEAVILIYVVVEIITQFIRVWLVYPKINLKIRLFYTKILLPSLITLAMCVIPAVVLSKYYYPNTWYSLILMVIVQVLIEMPIIFLLGLDIVEKRACISFFRRKL